MRVIAISIILALAGFSAWLLYDASYTKTQYWSGVVQMEEWKLQELHRLRELLEKDQIEDALLKLKELRERAVNRITIASSNFAPGSDYAKYANRVACAEIKSWKSATLDKCE